jgi:hypothetical protein
VGEGVMTITDVSEDTVKIRLMFEEPFESESPIYYAFNELDGKTEVTWYMEGEIPYPWNIMGLFFSMEDTAGKDFEKGLKKMKTAVEKQLGNVVKVNTSAIGIVEVPMRKFIGRRSVVKFDDMQSYYSENFTDAYTTITENEMEFDGSPSGIYFSWEPENEQADMATAIPVKDLEEDIEGFEIFELGGRHSKLFILEVMRI